ncbi:response regulator [Actinoplanes derwentensis]|uniref:Response regulator receiver domain-containing protein n=1 Tax=Actinoplanes derwentensis TaxID=113562 RepID=A0A1H1VXZ2_9ACTN|nr:response regulator [Actinoplanes derwentensis]GID83974.1 response regulator [Actinoplanes derwentensis]SDS89310.1 Response regulator receiver domain-containing protein [Actinoplanes derwentensis]
MSLRADDLVFVVEDSDEDVEAIGRAIGRSHPGTRLEFFRSGAAALSRFAEGTERPWLALLDLNMPGESGLDVLRGVRADRDLDGVTVVVFTSSENQDEADACFAAGADSYIYKPINFALFQSVLSQTLDYWRSRPAGNDARMVVPPPGDSSAQT